MKILGIGNAIVDVICKVEDNFLSENNLTKSTMKLVDETEFKKLLSNLKIEETISGGSVANSIVGLSQLGNKVGFIGKVNRDELGFLVPPGEGGPLSSALVKGLRKEWNRDLLRAEAQKYSWERVVDEYIKVYEAAILSRRRER